MPLQLGRTRATDTAGARARVGTPERASSDPLPGAPSLGSDWFACPQHHRQAPEGRAKRASGGRGAGPTLQFRWQSASALAAARRVPQAFAHAGGQLIPGGSLVAAPAANQLSDRNGAGRSLHAIAAGPSIDDARRLQRGVALDPQVPTSRSRDRRKPGVRSARGQPLKVEASSVQGADTAGAWIDAISEGGRQPGQFKSACRRRGGGWWAGWFKLSAVGSITLAMGFIVDVEKGK